MREEEWLVHAQCSRRRKDQAERTGQGAKGHERDEGTEKEAKTRTKTNAEDMDSYAYARLGMQPLPAVVLRASRLLGYGDEYVVFPRTRKKFLRKVNRVIDSFRIGKVLEAGAVITGSFLLHHLMQGAKWHPNDLDLFGTPAALRVAKQLFWGPDVDISLAAVARGDLDEWLHLHLLPHFMCDCRWVFDAAAAAAGEATRDCKPDQVAAYTEWTTLAGFKVKFFCVGGSTVDDVRDAIAQFDLALCRSFFDGRFIYVPRETHAALQVRRAPLTYTQDKLSWNHAEHLLQFASKYRSRGFQVVLPSTLCIASNVDKWNMHVCFSKNALLTQRYNLPAREVRVCRLREAQMKERFLASTAVAAEEQTTPEELDVMISRHHAFLHVSLRTEE